METLVEAYGKGLVATMVITILVIIGATGSVLIGEEVGGWPLVMAGATAVYVGWRERKRR